MTNRDRDEQLAAVAERTMTVEDFNAYVDAPISKEEREELHSLIAWFERRYPDARSRLEANRRAWRNSLALRRAK